MYPLTKLTKHLKNGGWRIIVLLGTKLFKRKVRFVGWFRCAIAGLIFFISPSFDHVCQLRKHIASSSSCVDPRFRWVSYYTKVYRLFWSAPTASGTLKSASNLWLAKQSKTTSQLQTLPYQISLNFDWGFKNHHTFHGVEVLIIFG